MRWRVSIWGLMETNEIHVRSVLNRHKRRDDWFLDDYSINPYSGCSFNCIYCYIRGSKYGKNMTETISVKVNAPEVLQRQLRRRALRREYGIIALSTSTEPYMQIERKYEITRKLLEIILKYRFPVHILTKSNLILRDLDLLCEIDEKAVLPGDLRDKLKHGVIISFSLSTLDERLAGVLEPGAPKPKERLESLLKCREEGFQAGVCYIPILPYLSDGNEQLEEMIVTAKDYGADYCMVGALTLYGRGPSDSKTLYYNFLRKEHPDLIVKYESLYRGSFQPRMEYQRRLEERARRICLKHGVKYRIVM